MLATTTRWYRSEPVFDPIRLKRMLKTQSAHTSPRSPPQLLHRQSRWSRGSNLEHTHFLFFSPLYHQISTCTEVWLSVMKEVSLQSHIHTHTHALYITLTHTHTAAGSNTEDHAFFFSPPPTLHRFRKEGARHTHPRAVRWISQQARLFFFYLHTKVFNKEIRRCSDLCGVKPFIVSTNYERHEVINTCLESPNNLKRIQNIENIWQNIKH